MNAVTLVSLVAGGSSLAAGIISLVMSGMRRELPTREPRDSKKAEFKALEKDIKNSVVYSQRKLQRFRWLMAVASAYFVLGAIAMLLPSREGRVGPISSEIFHYAASVVAGLAGAMLVMSAAQAYILIRKDQEHIEQKMAQLQKKVQPERRPLATRR